MQQPTQQSTPCASSLPTFTSTETVEAVQDYTMSMLLAAEVRPYSLQQDMAALCLPKLEEVRKAATAEGLTHSLGEHSHAVDSFVAKTQARAISLALAEDNTAAPIP